MAKILNLHQDAAHQMTIGCPDCRDEFSHFLWSLIACDSIEEPAIESFGYSKAKSDTLRRHWTCVLSCSHNVSFIWKKAEVSNLDIDC